VKKIALAAGIALLALVFASCPTGVTPEYDGPPSLRLIWEDYFPMGNIAAAITYTWRPNQSPPLPVRPADVNNTLRTALLARHFAIITAEDCMKPDLINTEAWNIRADNLANWVRANNWRLHGHALAWHGQTPDWMFATDTADSGQRRAEARANLIAHIELVMMHQNFRDIESWDVLNEVVATSVSGDGTDVNQNNWRTFLRGAPGRGQSGWYASIGSSDTDPDNNCFIWIAFTTARRVADSIGRSDMLLYYNDYNEEQPGKRMVIYYMVREMNQRWLERPNRGNDNRPLIQVIGMQAHYPMNPGGSGLPHPWGPINPERVRDSIRQFSQLYEAQGVLISITELDLTIGNIESHTNPISLRDQGSGRERAQAIMYARLFQIFREYNQYIRRVSIWGIDDPSSWRAWGSPVLWDASLQPKEAFWAVADPDAFVDPATGDPRSDADINAFLADPRNNGTILDANTEYARPFIPEHAWRR